MKNRYLMPQLCVLACVAVAVVGLLGGCASRPPSAPQPVDARLNWKNTVYIKIDSFNKTNDLAGKTFLIAPGEKAHDQDDLEFQTYADALAQGLVDKGLARATGTNFDLSILLRFRKLETLPWQSQFGTDYLSRFSIRVDIDDWFLLLHNGNSSLAQITISVSSFAPLVGSDAYLHGIREMCAEFPFRTNPYHKETKWTLEQ